jgi:XTP/dITP diphosphohydrolase
VEIYIGTTNKGKLSELRALFGKHLPSIVVKSLADVPSYFQPPENGQTFLDNARLKARSLKAMRPGIWVLAEDSGLEVDVLGKLPGIHSARYAGPKASDSENVAKLNKMIQLKSKAGTDRSARFYCSLVAFDPAGNEHVFDGEMKGSISKAPAGQLGFGYDPVFIPDGETKTLAELGPGFKNTRSHRSVAALKLIEVMKQTT